MLTSGVAQSLQEGVGITVSWPGTDEEYERFLRQCAELARFVPDPHLVAFYHPEQADPVTRSLQAVRIAMGNNRIFSDTDATLGWINHHGVAPIRSLRNIGGSMWGPGRSEKANRLVMCWMELGMMADALQLLASLPDGSEAPTKAPTAVNFSCT